jgi:hypothetical protein
MIMHKNLRGRRTGGGALGPAEEPSRGVDSREPLPSESNDTKLDLRGSGPDDCLPVVR